MDLTKFSSNATKIQYIKNKDGLRPLEIAELKLQPDYVFKERLTLMVLLSAYKPRVYGGIPTSGMTLRSKSELLDVNKYKDRVNALLLVATLIATVTFSAGIAVPGGFNSSAPNLGMSILAKKPFFIFFLLSDMMAMQSSVLAIIALIWAQMGDQELVHRAFRMALPSLSFALYCISFAFFFGVLATTSHNHLLVIVISILHSVFCCMLSYLLAPYVGPYFPDFRLFQRSVDIYIRVLLQFVDEDVAETHQTSV
ncbi:protein ACCELERATED CELL DEATH 6 [Eutrema salsugineum]|uniref:protein ACCELERATED CELL DEATH 6 n=1 Tax=Eutrema salsugineum TaxID=72664 RepID=UPI000CED511C|nr:protein ACCELERATED CELL DEATH 6 [Eutrema salsugineum]